MTAPVAELQKAIFTALEGDAALVSILGAGRIHDLAPARVEFPYITFGRTIVYDWSTTTEAGTEQLVTLHVWSRGRGKREAIEIMDRVAACLHEADLALTGHHLISLRQDYSDIVHDDDLSVHHGMLRLRALTEPSA